MMVPLRDRDVHKTTKPFESEKLLDAEALQSSRARLHSNSQSSATRRVLIFSLLANIILLLGFVQKSHYLPSTSSGTVFAHLSNNLSVPWRSNSSFHGGSVEEADRVWDSIQTDSGSIALSDAYAAKMSLPRSQRFPWDHDKGIYILNGYHSMHCLKTIRQYVRQVSQNQPAFAPAGHILHCLDALRQDIQCYADDTPRYTGLQPSGRSGTGQHRLCRDWAAIETWAQGHSACWRYLHGKHSDMNIMEEFRFCPKGSPYQETMEAYFREYPL